MKFDVIGGGILPEMLIRLTHSEQKRTRYLKKFEGNAAVDEFGDVGKSAEACTDCLMDRKHGGKVYVVWMRPDLDSDAAHDAAVLAHETTHIAIDYLEEIGEDEPGEEMRAYVVQCVVEYLVDEHAKWKKRHI